MKKYLDYIKINKLGVYYIDKMFSDLTTIKIGGKIRLLFYPNSIDSFIKFYRYYLLYKDYELIVIGNGSNVLASDNDFDGIVITFKKCLLKYTIINNIVHVNSGVMINDLINYLKKKNLGGLEKLYSIPATIGGMVKMNAGAYHVNISDKLKKIKCIDNNGYVIEIEKNDIVFDYRRSSIPNQYIILECVFELEYKSIYEINENIKYVKESRLERQPVNELNAGSTFKNILPFSSWKLIDKVGMRGFSINDACVSEKHCNFLINKNKAKSEEMCRLIELIKEKVKQEFNHELECEWIFINF